MTITLRSLSLLTLLLTAGCAETTAPLPPAEEVLLVVNSTEATLSVIPIGAPSMAVKIPLGGTSPTPVGVAARGAVALVPLGNDNAVAVLDLRAGAVTEVIPLPGNSGATGVAIVNDSVAYVANPNINTVTRINYLSGDTASVAVGTYPQGIIATRGKVFVMNGNLVNFTPAGESWISVIDPVTNQLAAGIDSIPLPGPGNAGFAVEGTDGLLYVMSSGDFVGEGRLSIVDPVARTEVASFGGFGAGPGPMAMGPDDRLFISSFAEGLMEFDILGRSVTRGAGDGVNIPGNSSVAVDSRGRIYAISTGPCQAGQPGVAHVLREDLTESGTIPLGECAIGTGISSIPPD